MKSGRWAALWRSAGTKRGGGTTTSILPVLAVGTFPGKQSPGGLDLPPDDARWTGWQYFSYRRIARLSGIHQESIGRDFGVLADAGLLQRHAVQPGFVGGPKRWAYRLSLCLYAQGRGTFVRFPAAMVYGGMWAYLPTRGARHLFVVIAALDPVLDEAAYRAQIEEFGEIDPEGDDPVMEQRARHPMSLGRLASATGMVRNAVSEALGILETPVAASTVSGKPDLALVTSGPARLRGARWFSPNMAVAETRCRPALLNNREALERDRLARYEVLARRRPTRHTLRIM